MKIEVNIDKKYAFLILSSVLLLIGVIAVWAYSGNYPTLDPVPAGFENRRAAYAGHTPDEMFGLSEMINISARQISEKILSDYMGLNCPDEPIVDTASGTLGYKDNNVKKSVAIPGICYQSGGCFVRQEIYYGNNLRFVRGFIYKQSYTTVGNTRYYYWDNLDSVRPVSTRVYNGPALNADGVTPSSPAVRRNYLFPIYENANKFYIAFVDDYGGIEIDPTHWSALDLSDKWAMRVYVCDPAYQVNVDLG